MQELNFFFSGYSALISYLFLNLFTDVPIIKEVNFHLFHDFFIKFIFNEPATVLSSNWLFSIMSLKAKIFCSPFMLAWLPMRVAEILYNLNSVSFQLLGRLSCSRKLMSPKQMF